MNPQFLIKNNFLLRSLHYAPGFPILYNFLLRSLHYAPGFPILFRELGFTLIGTGPSRYEIAIDTFRFYANFWSLSFLHCDLHIHDLRDLAPISVYDSSEERQPPRSVKRKSKSIYRPIEDSDSDGNEETEKRSLRQKEKVLQQNKRYVMLHLPV